MFSVYAILDKQTQQIVYIGKTTTSIKDRFSSHLSDARCDKLSRIAIYIRVEGENSVEIIEMDYANTKQSLSDKEIWWINEIKPICNIQHNTPYKWPKTKFQTDENGNISCWSAALC